MIEYFLEGILFIWAFYVQYKEYKEQKTAAIKKPEVRYKLSENPPPYELFS